MSNKQIKAELLKDKQDSEDWSAYFQAALDKLTERPRDFEAFRNRVHLDYIVQDMDKPYLEQSRLDPYSIQMIAYRLYVNHFNL
jgi:hypothetical protein